MGAARPDGGFAADRSNRVRIRTPSSAGNANGPLEGPFAFLAEGVGFEPTKGYKPLLVFKTSAFNRSATPPVMRMRSALCAAGRGHATVGHCPASIE